MPTVDELNIIITANVEGLRRGVEQARRLIQSLPTPAARPPSIDTAMTTLERSALAQTSSGAPRIPTIVGIPLHPPSAPVGYGYGMREVLVQQLLVLRELRRDTAQLSLLRDVVDALRAYPALRTHPSSDTELAKRLLFIEKSGENAGLGNYSPSF